MESFRKLMGENLVEKNDMVSNANWNVLENLFQSFLKNSDRTQKIPKKIHQIWLGELPEKYNTLIKKVLDNHPDWEYKLWTEDELNKLPMMNKELYNSLTNFGAKSDVARYEILYNEGGIYLDTDFVMIDSFDKLIHNDFFTGVGHTKEPMVFNGLFGCKKNHKMLKLLLEELKKNYSNQKNLSIQEIMSFSGPYFFSKIFFDYVRLNSDEQIVTLPTPYFYPLPATERLNVRSGFEGNENLINSFITDKTICIHLWFTSWQ